jgi:hypothetical protein
MWALIIAGISDTVIDLREEFLHLVVVALDSIVPLAAFWAATFIVFILAVNAASTHHRLASSPEFEATDLAEECTSPYSIQNIKHRTERWSDCLRQSGRLLR